MAMRTIAPFLAYKADAGGTGVPLLAKGTPGTVLVAAADSTQTSIVATAYRLTDGMEFVPMANNHGAVEGFRVDIPDYAPGIWFVSGPVASYQPTVEGSRGERGLPGVNGVENDAAVGGYMATPGTNTRAETKLLVTSELNEQVVPKVVTALTTPGAARDALDERYAGHGALAPLATEIAATGAQVTAMQEITPSVEELCVVATIGGVAQGSTVLAEFDWAVNFTTFVAPFPLRILSVDLVFDRWSQPANDANHAYVIVRRARAGAFASIVAKDTKVSGGQAIVARTAWGFAGGTWNTANADFLPGDALNLAFGFTGTGVKAQLPAAATIRYMPL